MAEDVRGELAAACEARWPGAVSNLDTADALLPVVDRIARERAADELRKAADEFDSRLPDGTGNGRAYNSYRVAAMLRDRAAALAQPATEATTPCWCMACEQVTFQARTEAGDPLALFARRFIVCPDCGNKRCPKATDHDNACTGSNEPGQPGSAYAQTVAPPTSVQELRDRILRAALDAEAGPSVG